MQTPIEVPAELVKKYDVPGPRYTSYPTAPIWSKSVDSDAYGRALEEAGKRPDAPLSLYVHLPFCAQLCTYCGCNVVVSQDPKRADLYLDHVAKEIDLAADRLGKRTSLSQIHWGGGTPTFLTEAQLERLFGELMRRFQVRPGAEIALEVDPVVTTEGQLKVLRKLGFNRISMGVQDFDAKVQQTVKRIQPAAQTKAMLDTARAVGFGSVNFDLIYGLPHQTPETWRSTLEQVVAMRPDRTAVYSFAYVPEARPHQKQLPSAAIPRGNDKLALLKVTQEVFAKAGYVQIGMDHYAVPEDELAHALERRTLGRNFQGYTVRQASETVAFGATGISEIGGVYAQNVRPLPRYYSAVASGKFPTERGVTLSPDDVLLKRVIDQLMCNLWIDLSKYDHDFSPERERLREFEKDGLVALKGNEIEVTPVGRTFVRNVAMVFDAHLHEASGFSRTV